MLPIFHDEKYPWSFTETKWRDQQCDFHNHNGRWKLWKGKYGQAKTFPIKLFNLAYRMYIPQEGK